MGGVGGNLVAKVMRSETEKNVKGVYVSGEPTQIMEICGWLDYQSGEVGHLAYQSAMQDSTHVFLSDYMADYAELSEVGLSLEIGSKSYEVKLIDDPMNLHEHIETYLRLVE